MVIEMAWTKNQVRKELKRTLADLADIQMQYSVYSSESDEAITEAMDSIQKAIEGL